VAAFEKITAGLVPRPQQRTAADVARQAVAERRRVIIQAPTGVGKSYVAIATAADVGRPGAPGIIVTTTNSLGDQYLRDVAVAAHKTGISYARVMGARWYWCADSPGARDDGIPAWRDVELAQLGAEEAERERNIWLASKIGPHPATRYELPRDRSAWRYACPGYPACDGNRLGGCGSKAARAYGHEVDVVVSNYHMLAFAHRCPDRGLLPLRDAPVVIVDEAHELARVIAELDGGALHEETGKYVFSAHPEVRDALRALVGASLDRAEWPGNDRYHTEGRVPVDTQALRAFADVLGRLDPTELAELQRRRSEDPGAPAAGDVLALIGHFWASATGTTWRAWTTRKHGPAGWAESRVIQLCRVDAAEQIVPAMLPPAAVLLTGTVGDTMPTRLGLGGVQLVDLGQAFDWHKVTGTISRHSGKKTGNYRAEVLPRYNARADELAAALRRHRGALVLANAHEDVGTVAELLAHRLAGHRIFTQPTVGGSQAAAEVMERYVAHVGSGGSAVLIGVDSFATGLDLPGELCTLVAWWVCHPGVTGFFEAEIDGRYPGYLLERFRSRFAQGIGRLLRSPADVGEVFICDSRGEDHRRLIHGWPSRVDVHLSLINWTEAVR
jgi:ATP-dependent DNA helicase DinG